MKTITNRSDQPRIELAKNTWELFVKARKSNDNRFLHEDLIIVRDDACTTEIKTFKSGSSVSNFLCWFEQTYCVSVKQDFKCTIPYNDEGIAKIAYSNQTDLKAKSAKPVAENIRQAATSINPILTNGH
jgi:hypothetical protein